MSAVQEKFSVHSEPVWRERANFVVNAPLPEPGHYEQLWCRQIDEDSFEVCCIPFFLYDVALGDAVRTSAQSGRRYVVSGVLDSAGRFVFRVHFERSTLGNRDDVVARLREMGALFEWSSGTLLAVDARDEAHGREIADFLLDQENRGRLIYETGRTA